MKNKQQQMKLNEKQTTTNEINVQPASECSGKDRIFQSGA